MTAALAAAVMTAGACATERGEHLDRMGLELSAPEAPRATLGAAETPLVGMSTSGSAVRP